MEWHQTNRVKLQFGLHQEIPVDPMNLDQLHEIDMRSNHYNDRKEYHAGWINIWKNKLNDVLTGNWIEGVVTHTPEYMKWYRQNTISFLSIVQQLNDPRTTNTHNVARTTAEEIHFSVPHPQSTFCSPEPVHQTFGQPCESFNATNPDWMTNLFGVNLNTPNSAAAYVASLQQFDAPCSFGEQGQTSSAAATRHENRFQS